MQKARECLKELINRGQEMLKPKYNPNTITNAWQLANTGPSQEEIRNWERDVKSYAYRYLKNHYAYTIINNAFNYQGSMMINSVINYLENVYNDWEFWDKSQSNENIKLKTENKGDSIYDVFISHANADKQSYVDELKKSLDKLNIKIFYDKDTLEWGDNWKDKILEGVDKAEFAIIVISENFFGREWTEKELGEFLNRQNKNGQKIILPIIHNISVEQLKQRYPVIADIQALDSSKYTCDEIALKFASQLIKRSKI